MPHPPGVPNRTLNEPQRENKHSENNSSFMISLYCRLSGLSFLLQKRTPTKMKKFLLAATMLVAFASNAKAAVLGGFDWDASGATTLTLSPTVPEGNQVQNLPCVICGANQPQQPTGFGYNLFGNTGNVDTVSFFSTSVVGGSLALDTWGGVSSGYTLTAGSPFLTALGGNTSFSVGIDVNDTNVAQTLESFWFLNFTTQTVLAVYSPEPGGTLIPAVNDGTGFPDWTLTGFTLAGINPGDTIGFFARITGANDGPDSFFLMPVPGPPVGEVPLPGAAWLFLSGLGGLWALNRKRRNKNGDPALMKAA